MRLVACHTHFLEVVEEKEGNVEEAHSLGFSSGLCSQLLSAGVFHRQIEAVSTPPQHSKGCLLFAQNLKQIPSGAV